MILDPSVYPHFDIYPAVPSKITFGDDQPPKKRAQVHEEQKPFIKAVPWRGVWPYQKSSGLIQSINVQLNPAYPVLNICTVSHSLMIHTFYWWKPRSCGLSTLWSVPRFTRDSQGYQKQWGICCCGQIWVSIFEHLYVIISGSIWINTYLLYIDPAVYPHFDLYPSKSGQQAESQKKEIITKCIARYPSFDICESSITHVLIS